MTGEPVDVPIYVIVVLVLGVVSLVGFIAWRIGAAVRGEGFVPIPTWTEEEIRAGFSFAPEGSWARAHPAVPPIIAGGLIAVAVAVEWNILAGLVAGAAGAAITWVVFRRQIRGSVGNTKVSLLSDSLFGALVGYVASRHWNWGVGIIAGSLFAGSRIVSRRRMARSVRRADRERS